MFADVWVMDARDPAVERKERIERSASAGMMRFLTLDLTSEGDAFLIGVGAVVLFGLLYPLLGAWALFSFPIIFVAAVLIRSKLRARR